MSVALIRFRLGVLSRSWFEEGRELAWMSNIGRIQPNM